MTKVSCTKLWERTSNAVDHQFPARNASIAKEYILNTNNEGQTNANRKGNIPKNPSVTTSRGIVVTSPPDISDTDSDDVGSFSGTELWQYKLWQYKLWQYKLWQYNGNMQP
jgi:hypothetical protein